MLTTLKYLYAMEYFYICNVLEKKQYITIVTYCLSDIF